MAARAWQRIFDFGDGTDAYFFLTPSANTGQMRFPLPPAVPAANSRSGANRAAQQFLVPRGRHLDGSNGVLYLDGSPVVTNTKVTIRPWQLLARSNYLGRSQFPADPYFDGELDSVRIFSRALTAAEVRDVAYAHPALAHRYSFTNSSEAWDSIGMAHGLFEGNATVTNGALALTAKPVTT